MKSITLIFDQNREEEVDDLILPLFENNIKIKIAYKDFRNFKFTETDFLVCYLSDEQLREFLDEIIENHWKIGFLPHPEMKEGRQGFGISSNLEAAVENILQTEEVLEVDVLMANGKPVLNKLIIGNTFSLMYGSGVKTGFFAKLYGRMRNFFRSFRKVKLHPYTICWSTGSEEDKEKSIETAALGMVIVQHGKSSILSRRIIEDSSPNDGLMHCLVLAPKSVWEIIKFGFYSIFKSKSRSTLPEYVAHIKTDKIRISSEKSVNFAVDEILLSAKEIELESLPKALGIVPGSLLETKKEVEKKRVFKVQNLPSGELKSELLNRYLPLTNHATTEEFKWLFTALRENSQVSQSYLVLMSISTVIATFGLFGNSSPVIIGAMILAPLMSPIISLSMGVLRQEEKLIKESLKTIAFGLAISYVFAILITWLTPLNSANSEILARIRPNLLDLGIAAASGVAGAYAHAKKEIAKTLAGVAIAVALVPPLAVSGIGLGWGDWSIFWGALLLLGTNLAGMVLAAAMTFLLLGFSPFRLARKGLLISLFFVALISAPLGFGFSKMVKENKIIQRLSEAEIPQGKFRNVRVIRIKPMRISLTIISEKPLDFEELNEVKNEIIDIVGQEVELEISVGIVL
ncbi:TIGR00341 family protein [Aquiflexum balticum DSM 16537]|uniref:TIGR00341 family protein n=1 Tax=Aquiflexum balticum DSM 16537 TaxID=758820 RepID=A0A1W2HC66_9BACT|nr:TIGR00341 family protein [Aquiflexum balticum]SMD46424.1 TIGR00341 family protein [Aquiflexum balticum DSM 16537]